jgi:hypothetical protein
MPQLEYCFIFIVAIRLNVGLCEVGNLYIVFHYVQYIIFPTNPLRFSIYKKHYLNVASLFSALTSVSDIIPTDNTYEVNEKWKL